MPTGYLFYFISKFRLLNPQSSHQCPEPSTQAKNNNDETDKTTFEHVLQNFGITTRDVMITLNVMKTSNSPSPVKISYPKFLKKQKARQLASVNLYMIYSQHKVQSLPAGKQGISSVLLKKETEIQSETTGLLPRHWQWAKGLKVKVKLDVRLLVILSVTFSSETRCTVFRRKIQCLSNMLTFSNDLFFCLTISLRISMLCT